LKSGSVRGGGRVERKVVVASDIFGGGELGEWVVGGASEWVRKAGRLEREGGGWVGREGWRVDEIGDGWVNRWVCGGGGKVECGVIGRGRENPTTRKKKT